MTDDSAGLRASGLEIGYSGHALLPPIDLTVRRSEIVAVLGPSGSGKSTLLSTIAGIQPAIAGRIDVDGRDVTHDPIHRRGVGLIFQEPLLFPHLDVRDNVAYGLRRHGQSRTQARSRADELLAWVGLESFGTRAIDALSGGQAQRVALARALAPRPAVLLLDEPFSALDADLRTRLAPDVAAWLRDAGVAAVHVTHDRSEAAAIADRVVTLEGIATGSV
jgi:thiamine transport system ATP-binding protein